MTTSDTRARETLRTQGDAGTGTEPPGDGPRQPAWVVVALREMVVKLTDKNFLISTAVTVALLAGSFALQAFLARGADTTSVVVSGTGAREAVASVQTTAAGRGAPVDLSVTEAADRAAVEAAVRDESADVGLVHTGSTWQLVSLEAPDPTLAALVREAVQQQALAANAEAAGTTVAALSAGGQVDDRLLEPVRDVGVRYAVSLAFAFLFYMASLLFGMTIASSVVEEKQSRVIEILVASVSVRQLLVGKVLGNTVLAMAQMVLFVGIGLVGLSLTGNAALLPTLAGASGWFLVFFLAGFVALACLYAAAGALATRNEDLQSTTPVLTTVLVGALFVGIFPQGTVQLVASYVPVVSTIAMPVRLFSGEAAWWEPVLSLGVTVAFAYVAVVVGERLYSRALMQTQRRMSVREALRAGG